MVAYKYYRLSSGNTQIRHDVIKKIEVFALTGCGDTDIYNSHPHAHLGLDHLVKLSRTIFVFTTPQDGFPLANDSLFCYQCDVKLTQNY